MNNIYKPGTVYGLPSMNNSIDVQSQTVNKPSDNPPPPGQDIPRALNYFADYSGCGFWRMIWPGHLLTAYQQTIITGSTCMIRDNAFYQPLKSVRLQRQASPGQLQFYKQLRSMADQHGFRLIYEIDDIVFHEDIPDYNKFKFAFENPEIRDSIVQMMDMSDEITCTCDYMKQYFSSKINNKNITVIPNYPPRFWLDGFYDENTLAKNYDRHVKKRKRPRVLYAGSGAHHDVDNKTGYKDDFQHVRDVIRKTSNQIQWVFLGAYPPVLHDLVRSGKIEYHQWQHIYDLPRYIHDLKINCMVAPLTDNTFNRCKSDIKYIEACGHGIPVVCQDMVTYENADFKFNTGDDMIDQIKNILKDKQQYMKACRRARQYIQDKWLELPDNLNKYRELYTIPYGDPTRVNINKINNI